MQIQNIKEIIANMAQEHAVTTVAGVTASVQYPTTKAEDNKPTGEVHDSAPVLPPSYTAQPVVNNDNKEEAKAPAAATVVSIAAPTTGMMPDKAAVDAFVRRLSPGVDLLSIPGIAKPVLSKTGCAKVLKFFNIRTSVTMLDKSIDPVQQFISYTFKVSAIYDGECLYEAVGAANNHESKFEGKGMSSDSMIAQMAVKRATTGIAMWLLAR